MNEWLEDIFTETRSIKQDWVVYPYTSNLQMHTLQNYRWEGSALNTPIHQSSKTDCKHNVADDRMDCATRNDTPWNVTMKSSQSPKKGKQGLGQVG